MALVKRYLLLWHRKVPKVYAIGDCKEPNMIVDAIADGWRIANTI